jgi:uncharacterized lipoprotein
MRTLLQLICCLLTIGLCAGCSSQQNENRPDIYRGGQYYGDAVRAKDLKNK